MLKRFDLLELEIKEDSDCTNTQTLAPSPGFLHHRYRAEPNIVPHDQTYTIQILINVCIGWLFTRLIQLHS